MGFRDWVFEPGVKGISSRESNKQESVPCRIVCWAACRSAAFPRPIPWAQESERMESNLSGGLAAAKGLRTLGEVVALDQQGVPHLLPRTLREHLIEDMLLKVRAAGGGFRV